MATTIKVGDLVTAANPDGEGFDDGFVRQVEGGQAYVRWVLGRPWGWVPVSSLQLLA